MKRIAKNLSIALGAALLALTMFGCGNGEKPVDYDGTYRCMQDGAYYFLVIKSDDMKMYYGETEAFDSAVLLEDGEFQLTVRNEEGVTAVSRAYGTETVYTATAADDAPALYNETKNRTYVKL